MFVAVSEICMQNGTTRLVIDGPFPTSDAALRARLCIFRASRYHFADTTVIRVDSDVDTIQLALEQVLNLLRVHAPAC